MSESSMLQAVVDQFINQTGLTGLTYEEKSTNGVPAAVIELDNPAERHYKILDAILGNYSNENDEAPYVLLKKGKRSNLLLSPEANLMNRSISETLRIDRNSFGSDFMNRYTKSLFGAEEQIVSRANHVVYGRRGSGKSSLLLYAKHSRSLASDISLWIDMQLYAKREEENVITDVLVEILQSLASTIQSIRPSIETIVAELSVADMNVKRIRSLLPQIKQICQTAIPDGGSIFIFLDDLHVMSRARQSLLLDVLYSFMRGIPVYLKVSAIESLTMLWDASSGVGLQEPGDILAIKLDSNLLHPDKAHKHINEILSSHATYCGISSARKLCSSSDVIARLTWVSAGVLRDALYLFIQSMQKAKLEGKKNISVSHINTAASDATVSKEHDLDFDLSTGADEIKRFIERIKNFCIKEKRQNAFLVEIGDNWDYKNTLKLIDLRLLHLLSDGVTPSTAGRKFIAVLLDYGYYTGKRAAQSVKLFNPKTGKISYADVRKLPQLKVS